MSGLAAFPSFSALFQPCYRHWWSEGPSNYSETVLIHLSLFFIQSRTGILRRLESKERTFGTTRLIAYLENLYFAVPWSSAGRSFRRSLWMVSFFLMRVKERAL